MSNLHYKFIFRPDVSQTIQDANSCTRHSRITLQNNPLIENSKKRIYYTITRLGTSGDAKVKKSSEFISFCYIVNRTARATRQAGRNTLF